MLAYFMVAVVLPTIILGHQIIPCEEGHPTPTALQINGCDSSPCNVDNGGAMTYSVQFLPLATSPEMILGINSTVFGETREIELPPALRSACNTMTPACPVQQGQTHSQGATIPVSSEFHGGIPAQLKVTMTNAANVVNFCCLINLIIH